MRIFIMRHGEAQFWANVDQDRNLSMLGKKESMQVGKKMFEEIGHFDYVFSSSYLRAKQTLEALKSILPEENLGKIEITDFLVPDEDPEKIISRIQEIYKNSPHSNENILLITHMPLVSKLVSELCNKMPYASFSTADVAQITINHNFEDSDFSWYYKK